MTPRRVVHVLTQTEGGPVDHTVDVAVAMVARGIDTHVVGPTSGRTLEARTAGVTWHPLSMTSKRDLVGGLDAVRTLRALRPDVLHLQDRRAGWVGRGLGRTLPGTAVVYTLHGVADGLSDLVAGNALAGPRRRRDRLYYLHGERWVTRWGRARVVSPSAAVARFAVDEVGLPASVVDVVPNGVDPVHFAPEARGLATTELLDVAWLGGLVPVKRLDVALDAVAATPGVRLLVAGGGAGETELRRRAAGADLAGRVEVLGHVADPRVVLHRAHAYLLSSAAESCPMALLQAMACGLPVVASAVGGVPEVVRHEVEGLLCPAGAVADVARALRCLVDEPGDRARMGAAGRRRVLERYTLERCVDGLLASYREAARCAS